MPDAKCPKCGHTLRLHVPEFGCTEERNDIGAQDGALCECKYIPTNTTPPMVDPKEEA